MFEIAREDVEAGRQSEYVGGLDALSADVTNLGMLWLVFIGYDDDPRELWEIPEVRRWFARLVEAVPHLLYLLDPLEGMPKLYFALLMPSLHFEHVKPLMEQSFRAANAYLSAAGVDLDDPYIASLTNMIGQSLRA
jgi:hypothetical protein